jgi:ribonuclease D
MKDDFENSYCFVDTASGLKDVARVLEKEKTVAVDLEADSMFHFKEKVCLIQIASKGVNAVIDPLEIGDISCLKPFFSNRKIKKIFHGADYDVRSLHRDFNITINNLFDTEIAVKFLGAKATGLDAVLKQKFNITLDKKYQKKDWSQRPLPENMVKSAASEAIHLLPLVKIL